MMVTSSENLTQSSELQAHERKSILDIFRKIFLDHEQNAQEWFNFYSRCLIWLHVHRLFRAPCAEHALFLIASRRVSQGAMRYMKVLTFEVEPKFLLPSNIWASTEKQTIWHTQLQSKEPSNVFVWSGLLPFHTSFIMQVGSGGHGNIIHVHELISAFDAYLYQVIPFPISI